MRNIFFTLVFICIIIPTQASEIALLKRKKLINNKHQGIAITAGAGKSLFADLSYYKTKYIVVTTTKQSYGIEVCYDQKEWVYAPKAALHFKFFRVLSVGAQALFYTDLKQLTPALRTEVGYIVNKNFEVRGGLATFVWTNDLSTLLNKYTLSIVYSFKLT